MSSGLSLAAMAEVPVRWADHGQTLTAGRPVFEPDFALFPAMLGDEMVAAVYVAQPEGLSVEGAAVFGAGIAQAVRASESVGTRRAPEASPADEARLQMLSLLERNDWNIAAVARLLGVRPAARSTCGCAASGSSAGACRSSTRRCRSWDERSPAPRRARGQARPARRPGRDPAARAAEVVLGLPALRRSGPRRELAGDAVAGALLQRLVLDAEAGRLRRAQDGSRPRAGVADPRRVSRRLAHGARCCWPCSGSARQHCSC